MLIKVVERGRVLLPFTLSHGMLISTISFSSERIMARKRTEPEIFSMPYGSQIFSCIELRRTKTGHSCVPMNALVLQLHGVKNSKSSMSSTKERGEEESQSKLDGFGSRLLNLKSRLVPLTCFTRITAIENPTNKT
jgi:hypothetical protein